MAAAEAVVSAFGAEAAEEEKGAAAAVKVPTDFDTGPPFSSGALPPQLPNRPELSASDQQSS